MVEEGVEGGEVEVELMFVLGGKNCGSQFEKIIERWMKKKVYKNLILKVD